MTHLIYCSLSVVFVLFALSFRCLLCPHVSSEENCCSVELAEENAAADSVPAYLVLCDPAILVADPRAASCSRVDEYGKDSAVKLWLLKQTYQILSLRLGLDCGEES